MRSSSLSPNDGAPRIHLDYLDGLRALAALFVVVHHAFLQEYPVLRGVYPSGAAGRWFGWLLYGHFAVDLFIVLSGFCLMLPVARSGVLKGGALSFFKKRARRILPPFYCALGVSLLFIFTLVGRKSGTHWDISLPPTPKGVLSNLLLLQDVWHPVEINHVFWSIAVEWHIYFLFPLLVVLWRRLGAGKTVMLASGGFVGLALVLHFLARKSGHLGAAASMLEGAHVHYVALFVFGMLGASLAFGTSLRQVTLRTRVPWGALALAGTVLVAGTCWRWGFVLASARFIYLDVLAGLCSLCLLVEVSRHEQGLLHRGLSVAPLVWVGTFAYSLYLIHAPLLQVVWQYLLPKEGRHLPPSQDLATFGMLLLIGLPLIVLAAYGFHLAFERPFMTSRKRANPETVAREAAISPAP